MMMTKTCDVWCTICGVRLAKEEIKGWGCPKCGNVGVPCAPDLDVTVEVNWHELHILCVWAENYARATFQQSDKECQAQAVYAIARRLELQWPDISAKHRLTLGMEIADLPDQLAAAGIEVKSVESNVSKPPPFLTLGPGAVGHARKKEA